MEGLPQKEQDVVSNVHHVVYGPKTAGPEAPLDLKGALRDLDPLDEPSGVAEAKLRHLYHHACLFKDLLPQGKLREGQGFYHRPGNRGHLPGQAVDGKTIPPVGGDGYFQDRLIKPQGLDDRLAQGGVFGKLYEATFVRPGPKLVGGTEHPFRTHPPQFRL